MTKIDYLIELFDNLSQLLGAGLAVILATYFALKANNSRPLFLMAGGMACFFLGSLFWTLHLYLLGDTPVGFAASDISWMGSFFFLISLNSSLCSAPKGYRPPGIALVVPILISGSAIVMALLYKNIYGSLFSTLIWAVPLTALGYSAVRGWFYLQAQNRKNGQILKLQPYYLGILVFLLLEHLLFWAWGYVYYGLDFLLTLSLLSLPLLLNRGLG